MTASTGQTAHSAQEYHGTKYTSDRSRTAIKAQPPQHNNHRTATYDSQPHIDSHSSQPPQEATIRLPPQRQPCRCRISPTLRSMSMPTDGQYTFIHILYKNLGETQFTEIGAQPFCSAARQFILRTSWFGLLYILCNYIGDGLQHCPFKNVRTEQC